MDSVWTSHPQPNVVDRLPMAAHQKLVHGDSNPSNAEYMNSDTPNMALPVEDDTDENTIRVFGWMHKQGTRVIRGTATSRLPQISRWNCTLLGPGAKSWRRRFFCLEGQKIYYFHEPVDARKYFNSRNPELCIGSIDLRTAFKLEQSDRLDLPSKGLVIHTKIRKWLVCPETDAEFNMWFDALEETIMTNDAGNVVKRHLPNVREYVMKGRTRYAFPSF
ncbi:hypothetical protein DYB32_005116 [Aphanomyces invadans]|uniref:PH domain-containing protein n=1 Tax=Aphanomyces invadans TaxID=157072 RepID=A0A418AVC3_9STRA|nr:hypothetical protein DYB32_005116 [Aphanomyces invadans]